MDILVIILIIIISVLLTLAVLVQNSKGGGLASNLSSTSNQFGVKKTSDFLEKLTWGLAMALILFCISSNLIVDKSGEEQGINSVNVERAMESKKAGKLPTAPSAPSAEKPEAPATPAPAKK